MSLPQSLSVNYALGTFGRPLSEKLLLGMNRCLSPSTHCALLTVHQDYVCFVLSDVPRNVGHCEKTVRRPNRPSETYFIPGNESVTDLNKEVSLSV